MTTTVETNTETKSDMDTVTLDQTYPHPPEQVWRALTSRRALERWLLPNDFQPRLGHCFTFRDKSRRIDCEVIALDEGERLAYTWREGDEPLSVVSWTLEPVEAGTRVCLRHQPAASAALGMTNSWTSAMETLGEVLEPVLQMPIRYQSPMKRWTVSVRTQQLRRVRMTCTY